MSDFYEDLANEMGNTDRYIQPDEEESDCCGEYTPCPHGMCRECESCHICEDEAIRFHERTHAPGEV